MLARIAFLLNEIFLSDMTQAEKSIVSILTNDGYLERKGSDGEAEYVQTQKTKDLRK